MRVEFLTGNEACAEGAITAGLKVYAGYPITPSSDLFEYLALKLPKYGGFVYPFEDEIASINALVGAALAGAKAMTATSGPGFSLMMEGIGLAVMVEAPVVIVDVMRSGPSTGIATQTGQGDIMQARWGSHGPYNLVVYAPSSAQECYDYTIKSFNVACKLRTPVIILSDATVGHTREKVVIRERGEVEVVEVERPRGSPSEYMPYKPNEYLVPPLAPYGEGYFFIAESLSHDERGYYSTKPAVYRALVERLIKKIDVNKDYVIASKSYYTEDAETVFVAVGSVARSTLALVRHLREKGAKVGLFKPISVWPIDDKGFLNAIRNAKNIVVAEMNQGQLLNIVKTLLWDNKIVDVNLYLLDFILPMPPTHLEMYNEIKRRGWSLW